MSTTDFQTKLKAVSLDETNEDQKPLFEMPMKQIRPRVRKLISLNTES